MHLELGSGTIKLRCSNRKLDDGAWHKVDLILNLRLGTVSVDNDPVDFETIGEEQILSTLADWADAFRLDVVFAGTFRVRVGRHVSRIL